MNFRKSLLVILFSIAFLLSGGSFSEATTVSPATAKASGHRGASIPGVAEETLSAMKYADASRAHSVEMDVRFSTDGKAFLLHDDTLDRTTNCTGPAESRTWANISLRKIDVNVPRGSTQRVESLDTVIAYVAQTKMYANIEVKNVTGKPFNITQATTVLNILKKHNMQSRTVISSFNASALKVMKCADTEKEIGWYAIITGAAPLVSITEAKTLGYNIVMPGYTRITPAQVADYQRNNIDVWVWTGKTDADYEKMRLLKANVIVTDDTLGYQNWLSTK